MAEQWILDLTKYLEHPQPSTDNKQWRRQSIYRVPKILTDVNSQAYEPKVASFGPYHHDCRHLRPMEQHKRRALIQFLRRIGKASKSPDDVLVAMKKVESSLRFSYDFIQTEDDGDDDPDRGHPRHHDWAKDEFLKLMITDGCFALEFMMEVKRNATMEQSEYDYDDPVFGAGRKNYLVPNMKRDMLLIENQLPLLALSTLADMEGSGIGDVNSLIKSFYNISSISPVTQSFHILDLYRKIMTANGDYLPSYEENVHSATELRDAGVSFCRSATKSFGDISFVSGKLSLPPLEIEDITESLIINLMAFECLHATVGNEVTAYAFFMDGLINSTDDVALLRTEGIIEGWVGCDSNIASMFNRITNEATIMLFEEDDVKHRLNVYCKKNMHKWRASFVHTYLKNPWVFFTLIGGMVLLGLTIVQTVYAAVSYYKA